MTKKLRWSVLSLWAGLLYAVAATSAGAQETVHIGVGEEYLAELPGISKSVDLGNASIVSVRKLDNKLRLIFKGLRNGETKARIRISDGSDVNYQFIVGDRLRELEQELATLDGLKYQRQGGRISVAGSLANKEAMVRFQEIKLKYGGLIIDGTEKNMASNSSVVRTINRVLRENDLGNFEANSYGRFIVLEGSPKNDAQSELALRIARVIHPDIENRISKDSNGSPAVSIEVLFVEASKGDTKTMGFKPQFNQANAEGAAKGSVASASMKAIKGSLDNGKLGLNWQVGGLANFLQLIQNRSSSRVMSNPRLVARSGTEAQFHAGETIYLQMTRVVKDEVVTELSPVDVGIMLNITPRLDEIGQIDSKILTEVSEMSDVSTDKMPAISRSRVNTAVTIRDGQTIMLSGLVRKKNMKSVDRVPLLGDVPLLGELFKSRHTVDTESEMLVLVTMNRIRAYDEQAKAAGQKVWEKAGSDIEFKLND